jgi:hypothetical protein
VPDVVKRILLVLVGAGAATAAIAVLRRRAAVPREAEPQAVVAPQPSATTARIASTPGSVSGPEVREEESAETEETRYDRLGERESEERHAAAERVLADPLNDAIEREKTS